MMSKKQKLLLSKLQAHDKTTNYYFRSNRHLYDQLVNVIFSTYNFNCAKKAILKNETLKNWIFSSTSKLSDSYSIKTRIVWILFGLTDFPLCDNEKCNNKILRDVDNIYNGYEANSGLKYCCHKCSVSSEANKELHKKTCFERYGVESYTQTDECKQKTVATSLKKYGTINPGCSAQALEKIRQTNIERRGVPCSFQSEDVKRKSKESFIAHYGVDNNMKSEEGLKEYQDAMEKKYGKGIITNFQLESFKEKSKQTKLEKYGDENFSNPEKCKKTKLERYGDSNYNNNKKI